MTITTQQEVTTRRAAAPPPQTGELGTLWRFVRDVFPLPVYATYALTWSLAVDAGLHAAGAGGGWRPDLRTAGMVVTVLLMLFVFRAVDEQKDLEYDRVHNPDRPLVRGSVTAGQLRRWAVTATALAAVTGFLLTPLAGLVVLADAGYAVMLLVLERRSRAVRDGLLLNLVVTYPVQLILSGALVLAVAARPEVTAGAPAAGLVAILTAAFLHLEFARKTSHDTSPGARMYSGVLGEAGSAAVTAGLGAGAIAGALLLVGGGGAVLLFAGPAAALLAAGAVPFATGRLAAWPKAAAMAVMVLVHLSLVAGGFAEVTA